MKPRDWAALVIVSVLVAWLFSLPVFDRLTNLGIDSLFWLREQVSAPPAPATSPTVVIAVDEETYRQPPFKDTPYALWTPLLAEVVDGLVAADASVIGLDIIFPTSAQTVLPGYDRSFLVALRKASQQRKIVLTKFQSTTKAVAPYPGYELAVGGANIRAANLLTDRDDAVRRFPLFLIGLDGGRDYHEAGFALELAMRLTGKEATAGKGDVRFGDRRIPADALFGAHVNFRGGDPIPTYSLADIHACIKAGRADFIAEQFRGKAVLIGAVLDVEDRKLTSRRYITGPEGPYATPRCALPVPNGLYDATLYRRNTPGVYIHAQAVNDLVRGDTPNIVSRFGRSMIIAAACLLTGALALSLQPYFAALLIGMLALAWIVIATIAFRFGTIVPLFDPPLGGAVAHAILMAYRFKLVDQNQRRLRRAFSYYLPASLLEKMVASETPPALGGEERQITVWFSDLANFTSSSEGRPPQAIVQHLNRYFDTVVAIIEKHGGYVDKFVGDGIVAFFGAPLTLDNPATSALQAAREVAEELGRLAPDGSLTTRIGIHTGKAVIGNIGSSRRFNYTAIGDSVNVAARLESANKALGTTILLSESTKTAAGDETDVIALGQVRVMGRLEPLKLYTLPLAGRKPPSAWDGVIELTSK